MIEVFQKEQNVGMVGNVQKLADSIIYDHAGVVFGPAGNPRHFGQGFLFNPIRGGRRRWSAVTCLLYTSPSPRDATLSRMPSSA